MKKGSENHKNEARVRPPSVLPPEALYDFGNPRFSGTSFVSIYPKLSSAEGRCQHSRLMNVLILQGDLELLQSSDLLGCSHDDYASVLTHVDSVHPSTLAKIITYNVMICWHRHCGIAGNYFPLTSADCLHQIRKHVGATSEPHLNHIRTASEPHPNSNPNNGGGEGRRGI